MKPIVTRSQHAKHCWLIWSEVTSSLPRPIVIGQDDEPHEGVHLVHCPCSQRDVELALRDLELYPDQAIVCNVGRLDEEITIPPDVQRQIDGMWQRFGNTGRLFGTIGDGAAWMARQSEPATV